jgi:hypothetical protein
MFTHLHVHPVADTKGVGQNFLKFIFLRVFFLVLLTLAPTSSIAPYFFSFALSNTNF